MIGYAFLSVGCFALGVVLGIALGVWAYSRAFSHVAQFQRTGRPTAGAPVAPVVPGGEMQLDPRSLGPSIESADAAAAEARVIEKGADAFQELHPGMERDVARARARRALEETGVFSPAGGIPSA